MKHVLSSIRITFFLMLVLGIAYPLMMTAISQITFPKQANGSLIYENGRLRGSELIAQKFEKPSYFWPRPSGVDYNPLPSGATNLGPTAQALQETVKARTEKLNNAHLGAGSPPQHLLFASSSGLDPHQSVQAIQYQASRVAQARGLSREDLQKLIESHIARRQFGVLGEEYVNVLALNLALDKIKPLEPNQEPASDSDSKNAPANSSDSSGNN